MTKSKTSEDRENSKFVFSKYEYRRASDDIANEIKNAILQKEFTDGNRLPSERSLAEQFHVSRMTIREAFRLLEAKGIITVKKGPKGGAFIQSASTERIADIVMDKLQLDGLKTSNVTETRIIIERGIVEAVILNGTTKDFENIEEKLAAFKSKINDASDNVQLDTFYQRFSFHDALAKATHNNFLILYDKILRSWVVRMPRWFPDLEETKRIYQTYRSIIRAIQEKDASNAQKLIESYIRKSMKKIGR